MLHQEQLQAYELKPRDSHHFPQWLWPPITWWAQCVQSEWNRLQELHNSCRISGVNYRRGCDCVGNSMQKKMLQLHGLLLLLHMCLPNIDGFPGR
ncbi:hypothetical protein K1719_027065 [Acacia pycnantha]|nr:hypothetical protein K1719_027065 [Acacia pycnantha]